MNFYGFFSFYSNFSFLENSNLLAGSCFKKFLQLVVCKTSFYLLSHLLVVASNAEEEEEDAKFAELVLPNRTFGVSRLGFFSGISVLA